MIAPRPKSASSAYPDISQIPKIKRTKSGGYPVVNVQGNEEDNDHEMVSPDIVDGGNDESDGDDFVAV